MTYIEGVGVTLSVEVHQIMSENIYEPTTVRMRISRYIHGLWRRLFGLRRGTRVTVIRGKHRGISGVVLQVYGSWYSVRLSSGRGIRCYSPDYLRVK